MVHSHCIGTEMEMVVSIFIACKRNLGQGNIFALVCHFVHGGVGGWSRVGAWFRGGCLVETPETATAAGGTHATGMHSCLYRTTHTKTWSVMVHRRGLGITISGSTA